MNRQAKIWVLADDRAGNVAQAVGVAEALEEPFRTVDIRYDRWAALPNVLRGASLWGVTEEKRALLTPPWPDLVIAAGRRTAPVALWIKRQCHAKLVQIMDPGGPHRDRFDLIAVPTHDTLSEAPNIIRTTGACHRVTIQRLDAERPLWEPRFSHFPRPYLALLAGGTTKHHPFTAAMAEELAQQTLTLARRLGATILATTSRRSGPAVEAVLHHHLGGSHFLYCWREGTENPYMALIALADAIVVTGDSMNMCSEATVNGGPLFIYSPPGFVNAKYDKLHSFLYAQGYAKPLGQESMLSWTHPPLNASLDVATAIRQRGLLT